MLELIYSYYAGMKKVEYRYYSTGEEITLKCDCKAVYWNGPALENTGVVISQVDETDIYEEVKTWNISIYTKGDTIANTLPQSLLRRLHVIGDNFDLHITNLSLSDEGLYICDRIGHDCFGMQNRYILQNQYKPSIKVNISDNFIVEGETTQLCCTSTSKPKPTSIVLYKEDNELVSTNSRFSLCYKMINVSRNDTGNYTCFSKNEIGNASSEIPLVISYPPVVNIRHSTFTEDSKNMEIQCIAQGEPDRYDFFPWEHRSHFDQHIRYLGARDDGILHLPDVNVLNRYQDTGIYICNVSNGIPDYHGNVFQLDRAYIVSKGPPVFMKKSQIVQYGKEGYQHDLIVYVYSDSNITCSVVSNLYRYSFPHHVRTELILTSANFHGTTITLDGRQVVFSFPKLSRLDFQMYMVTLCNRYGNNSIHVELRRKGMNLRILKLRFISLLPK
ncbi:unnamed protein product [Mytilus coruscus]|uniref:Ig-like domain-containing protein n=1 Tax=Mytilus coruscus TaxID=42192 RepID=A0A6J8EVJ1_MYTCO|nr:unnamed protein product [Mytilus coruscus]